MLAAVRSATVGMPLDESAAAPFTDGRWLVSHNGRVDRSVLPARHDVESAVDSALLAAHVLALGPDRVAQTVREVARLDPAAYLSLLLTDGERVLGVTWGDTLSCLVLDDGVAVASEPWDDDPRWVDVPDHHLVEVTPQRGRRECPGGLSHEQQQRSALDRRRPPSTGPATPSSSWRCTSTPTSCPSRWPSTCAPGSGSRPRCCRRSTSTTVAGASSSTRSPGSRSTTRRAPSGRSCSSGADEVAAVTGAETLVELGSGTSEKTLLLLRALREAGTLTRFVPFDVDRVVLREAATAVVGRSPGWRSRPRWATSSGTWATCRAGRGSSSPSSARRSATSTPAARAAFLGQVRALLGDDGSLLLGTDLVKPVDRLVAAYDDAAGSRPPSTATSCASSTAAWGPTSTRRLRRTGWSGTPTTAGSRCAWSRSASRSCTCATSTSTVAFAAGEQMRTEISTKFHRAGVEAELAAAGLELAHWWTDEAGDFALSLSRPAARSQRTGGGAGVVAEG